MEVGTLVLPPSPLDGAFSTGFMKGPSSSLPPLLSQKSQTVPPVACEAATCGGRGTGEWVHVSPKSDQVGKSVTIKEPRQDDLLVPGLSAGGRC